MLYWNLCLPLPFESPQKNVSFIAFGLLRGRKTWKTGLQVADELTVEFSVYLGFQQQQKKKREKERKPSSPGGQPWPVT